LQFLFKKLLIFLIFNLIQDYTNFQTEDSCKIDGKITGSPKPKLRTKFSNYEEVQDTAKASCHITVSDDTCTTKTSENKNIDTIEMIKSPSLKWRRRSIKQSNYESDEDQEKGKQPTWCRY
jgi:hypothetical protein